MRLRADIISRGSAALFAVVALGCSSSSGNEGGGGDRTPDDLVLDFTAFFDGAIQISGVGVSATDGTVAVVTDFERVVLIDPNTVSATANFSVQFGNLPRQGSSEAVSYLGSGDLAVLFPEHDVIRTYAGDGSGAQTGEVDLSAIDGFIHGAMTIAPDDDIAFLVVGTGPLELVGVSLGDGSVLDRRPLTGDLGAQIAGLSLGIGGNDDELWAVTEDNVAFRIDVDSARATRAGTLPEMTESSGAEAFDTPGGESVLAVSDDSDEFNSEPGPLRLYLLD